MTTTELTTIPFQSHNHDAGKGQNETEVMQPTHDLYKTLNQCCLIMMGIGAITCAVSGLLWACAIL